MKLRRFFSPLHAFRDLRAFLHQRQPYELVFLTISVGVTSLLITAFVVDSREEPVYKRNITYFQNWPANRTDAEIIAQQKIDGVQEAKDKAELKRRQADTQASYKRMDDKLKSLGL